MVVSYNRGIPKSSTFIRCSLHSGVRYFHFRNPPKLVHSGSWWFWWRYSIQCLLDMVSRGVVVVEAPSDGRWSHRARSERYYGVLCWALWQRKAGLHGFFVDKRFLHSPKQSQTCLSQTGLVHKEFHGVLWMFPWKLVEHQHLAHPPAARAARVRPSMLYRNKSKSWRDAWPMHTLW